MSRMQNRAQVTMSIVNSMHLIYVNGNKDDNDSPGRVQSVHPENVDVQALDVVCLLQTGYSWVKTFYLSHSRRWHTNEFLVSLTAGCPLSTDCFFVVVGILAVKKKWDNVGPKSHDMQSSEVFFVLRRVQGLRQRKFFNTTATLFSLDNTTIQSGKHLGIQIVYSAKTLLTNANAVCAVVEYHQNSDHLFLIPTFGLINWD